MLAPDIITDIIIAMSYLNTGLATGKNVYFICFLALFISGCAGKKKTNENLAQEQVEQLYSKGKSALRTGNYIAAARYYGVLETNYPYGEYTEQAKLDLIFAYNKANQIEKAVSAADNFIQLYPTHANVDYAYYMKGVANFERKLTRVDRFMRGGRHVNRDPQPYRDSQDAFNDLIKRYPDSIYSEDAKLRLIYIRNALADRELQVAEFYFKAKTYVAAINRCKGIVYSYETSPAVEGALLLMEKSYVEMGLQDLAVSTHEVLVENFPDYLDTPIGSKKDGFFNRLNPFRGDKTTKIRKVTTTNQDNEEKKVGFLKRLNPFRKKG